MNKLAIIVSALLLTTACTDDTKSTQGEDEGIFVSQPAIDSPVIDRTAEDEQVTEPDVIKKFDWDWESPTEPYYTLGIDPMDDGGLCNQFGIEKDNSDYLVLRTDKSTVLYTELEGKYTYYTHGQVDTSGIVANAEQSSVLSIPETFNAAKKKDCVALTDGMVDAFDENELIQVLTFLESSGDSNVQTWVFLDEDDGGYYFSQRDINQPKGFTYRCKDTVIKDIKAGLSASITMAF